MLAREPCFRDARLGEALAERAVGPRRVLGGMDMTPRIVARGGSDGRPWTTEGISADRLTDVHVCASTTNALDSRRVSFR